VPARVVAAATVAALVASGGAAYAAPKKPATVCNQLVDDDGDAVIGGSGNPAGQPYSATLDVLSADIATGKKNVVAAIRLKSLEPDAFTTGGSQYVLLWTSNGTRRSLAYRTYADGSPPDAVFDADAKAGQLPDLVPVRVVVTSAIATMTFTMPRSLEPSLGRSGGKLTDLAVQTYLGVNRKDSFSSTGIDSGTSPRAYVDGTSTCLTGV
jgi:hypothetical protein